MALDPITREEHFLAKAAGRPAATLEPVTREEHFLQDLIDAQQQTPQDAVLYTEQDLTEAQKRQARLNIGASDESGIPQDFRENLIAALSAGAFATPNGAELIEALQSNE